MIYGASIRAEPGGLVIAEGGVAFGAPPPRQLRGNTTATDSFKNEPHSRPFYPLITTGLVQ